MELKSIRTELITQKTINDVQKGEINELEGRCKTIENENSILKDKIITVEQQLQDTKDKIDLIMN